MIIESELFLRMIELIRNSEFTFLNSTYELSLFIVYYLLVWYKILL